MAIDRQALDKLREIIGGEAADLIELIDSFLEEGPLLAGRLAASQQAADVAGARRAAHSLKANARDMGATELAEICARLEAGCATGVVPGKADIDAVEQAFAAAAVELRSMFPAEGSS